MQAYIANFPFAQWPSWINHFRGAHLPNIHCDRKTYWIYHVTDLTYIIALSSGER